MFDFGVEWYHILLIGIAVGILVFVAYIFVISPMFPSSAYHVQLIRPKNPFL